MPNKYLQYGVPIDWSRIYSDKKLSVSSFRNISCKQLKEKYDIPEDQIRFVKDCLKRQPIDKEILQTLLERNAFTCCLCRGQKSDAYIIHHIEPYSLTQDNTYCNLAVLCPNDHDLAHREGISLTNKISPRQIKIAKNKWEKEIEEVSVRAAMQQGNLHEIDFLNVPRILHLHRDIFKGSAITAYSQKLIKDGVLNNDGTINPDFIRAWDTNSRTPLNFWGPGGSWALCLHYSETFKQILTKIQFVDLDSLLNKKSIRSDNLTGMYCSYVGGIYSTGRGKLSDQSPEMAHLYFHRGDFWVEWIFDTSYMTSNSAMIRLGQRSEYLVYGRIMSVDTKSYKGKGYIHFNIRAYMFGTPLATKSRRPAIHYIDKYDDYSG